MTVSNPATFSSIKAEFGGSNNFKDYYRGGPYVASNASATISTTAAGLAMSQFNGVTKPAALAASASPTQVQTSSSVGGTFNTPAVTCTASGGSTYTYSWVFVTGDSTVRALSPTSASTQFQATISKTTLSKSAVYRCDVTSGGVTVSSNNVTASVNYTGAPA